MIGSHGIVRIHNLEFQGRHGATADERRSLRRFQVDIEVQRDVSTAARTDRLSDTVDYDGLCNLAYQLGTERTFKLLEALCGAIVTAIAERDPSVTVTVEVRKLNPPSPGNPAYSAVRIRHTPNQP